MEKSVVFAGFGGQGILLAGKVLARAGMNRGLEVTWLPSYGPEMRGGTANCTVVVADAPIGSPVVDRPDALVAMNAPSLDRFEPRVAEGGVIVVNSSLVKRGIGRPDVRAIPVPANDIAAELGNPRVINMVALGALVRALAVVSLEDVVAAMEEELRGKGRDELIELNREALRRGFSEAERYT
ncbi:MAG: 2-oxoacid:ferredoxin oxidoreductase subunit gamma [Caldiserica bacterium]|nr:2-oxoacid:ferredoxin oxidoreductase subunit gamma [Caldisericota bacterium]